MGNWGDKRWDKQPDKRSDKSWDKRWDKQPDKRSDKSWDKRWDKRWDKQPDKRSDKSWDKSWDKRSDKGWDKQPDKRWEGIGFRIDRPPPMHDWDEGMNHGDGSHFIYEDERPDIDYFDPEDEY